MSDMSDTIERLGNFNEYTVTRYKARSTTDGEADPLRVETTITIVAAIQPASGRDLLRLEEGQRLSEVIVLWTKTPLYSHRQGYPPDTLVYKGEVYQIESIERWDDMGNFYEALARLVPPPVVEE